MNADSPTLGHIQSFHLHVMDVIKQHAMVESGHRVLVGLSGGPDSSVLVHALAHLADRLSIQLAAAHCHHGLRNDADRDEAAARALADRLDIRFFRTFLDVRAFSRNHRMSLETAGRHLRYRYFRQLAAHHGFQRLALGHHRDDTAEQVLMNLIRGCGATGLGGIRPVRDGWIVRPMIRIQRQAILAYARSNDLPLMMDASNQDMQFTRNRVRHDLLPGLARDYNPRIVETLARFAELSTDERQWMNTTADALLASITRDRTDKWITIDAQRLGTFPRAAGRRILRRCLRRLTGHTDRITLDHVEKMLNLATATNGSGRIDLPRRIRVARFGPELKIEQRDRPHRQPVSSPSDYRIEVACPTSDAGHAMPLCLAGDRGQIEFSIQAPQDPWQGRQAGHHQAFFDIDVLCFPLVVRNWQPGDRLRPLGMAGTKKVRRLFNEQRVPAESRTGWPVVLSNDEIIWVPGVGRGDTAPIGPHTRSVLAVVVTTDNAESPVDAPPAATGSCP